ncbi:MAG: bis(5'-nucleosyl)-tetraphosphatase (symmetrical) YqeK [Anaerolineae bacterium]
MNRVIHPCMQADIDRYQDFLEGVLTPARLKHSLGVMGVMGELAPLYGLDMGQALTAGLLHDAAKDLAYSEQQRLVRQGKLDLGHYSALEYAIYLHGPLGACLVERELGVADPAVLAAIRSHAYYEDYPDSTSLFAWCLRFADFLEPNRAPAVPITPCELDWYPKGREQLAAAVYQGRLCEAAYIVTAWLLRLDTAKGFPVQAGMRLLLDELVSQAPG